MATGDRIDPYRGYNFTVEIDNITVAGFREASGLQLSIDSVEYREGNERTMHVRKLPGLRKYANIVLKRGITTNPELWNWYLNVVNGEADRRNGAIILRGESEAEANGVLRWNFEAAWPCKYEAPSFNATTNEVGIVSMELSVERVVQVPV
ncbi:phage tail protein [Paractinoplanes globisporus]|jgi:phage tail-like protein|uniref:Phage tail protein n=1 Tax=Paractinoplanes globisporus TaxID=113565 RepID=A0ABW6W6R9_9ACTN|nr:phage tail protein [Actinoplanes globisporus]